MTPEKEMQAFCELVRINTARIHERLDSLYGNPGRGEKLDIAKYAVVMAWEQRGQYEPSEAWITWFGKAVTLAAYYWDIRGGIKFTPQAGQLLHKVGEGTLLFDPYSKKGKRREAQVEFAFGCSGAVIAGELILQASLPVAHPERWAQEAEKPPHRYTKDCPPCWRCRYFDGWLPANEAAIFIHAKTALEPEIAESLLRIDKNKVRIAKWVRCNGLEDTGVDDSPVFDRGVEPCFIEGAEDGD